VLASLAEAAPVINEVQSTNTALPDQYGQFMDWVEIHNPTGSAINLQGYYLSDSTSNRLKFQFGNLTISAGGYLVVWCGQAIEFTTTGPYPAGQVRATNFNISSGGEPIVLTAPNSTTTVDEFPAQVIGAGRTLSVQLATMGTLLPTALRQSTQLSLPTASRSCQSQALFAAPTRTWYGLDRPSSCC
jgi:hypothetical protein